MKQLSTYSLLLVSVLFSAISMAELLQRGESRAYTYTAVQGSTYELSFVSNGSSCSSSAEGACCAMFVIDGNQTPSWDRYHYMSASNSSTEPAKVIVQKVNTGGMGVAIYAFDRCDYSPPVIESVAASNSISTEGVGVSQLGEQVAVQTVQVGSGQYALRDETRQQAAGNGGRQIQGNAIFSEAAIGYFEALGRMVTEPARDSDNMWFKPIQEELTDAHHHSGIVYDFMNEVMGINSYDDRGAEMLSFVNARYPTTTASFCGYTIPPGGLFNAYWNGYNIVFSRRFMTDFFDQEYKTISYAAALDVTAHEWAHAISDRAVNLRYQRESGALNEAFSDWVGAAVEFYAGESNWTMGEGVEIIRDMKNPKQYRDPDTYGGEYWRATSTAECAVPDICENDYCGVHINSGVANKMFQLLVDGGSHNNVAVEGIGVEKAIQIAYDAIRYYWTSNETFAGARQGMEQAADSYSANDKLQVALAWYAVGVGSDPEASSGGSASSGGAGGCSIARPGQADQSVLLVLVALLGWRLRRRLVASK